MSNPLYHFTGFVRVDISGGKACRRIAMGNRAQMTEEYKRTDPEFVKMQEEASRRLDVADHDYQTA